ncbi:MAG: hypothetical protein Q8928_14130 [Bacteroidota bacterium]|nr:hypothetical protein [Bacteroidota bacterium]
MASIFELLKVALNSSDRYVVVDANGKNHELNEEVAGTPKFISKKESIAEILFDKSEVDANDIKELNEIFTGVINTLNAPELVEFANANEIRIPTPDLGE